VVVLLALDAALMAPEFVVAIHGWRVGDNGVLEIIHFLRSANFVQPIKMTILDQELIS
jgi:hypothetical protein